MSKNEAVVISGKVLSDEILAEVAAQVDEIKRLEQRQPCLVVVLVGEDPASQVYVRNKKNACSKVGITSLEYLLSAETAQEDLLKLIQQLNQDDNVDGILVQLPLPNHLDSKVIIDNISPFKDVDGFHRYNMGALALKDPNICPCTPHGVMYMLDSIALELTGKHAVVLGTSNIVGRPMALELINRGVTVTMCNSKTTNVPELVAQADIVVAAVGKPNFVQGEWLKDGAVVLDVGINRLESGKLCGDVNYDSALNKASYITPVPGGVGPMTIAMLLKNTLKAYQSRISK